MSVIVNFILPMVVCLYLLHYIAYLNSTGLIYHESSPSTGIQAASSSKKLLMKSAIGDRLQTSRGSPIALTNPMTQARQPKVDDKQNPSSGLPFPDNSGGNVAKLRSRFAYVTLMHGIDDTFKYRGFLYNVIIMKKSLEELGSTEDFYCFVGFSNDHFSKHREIFEPDLELLQKNNVKLFFLPRLEEGLPSSSDTKISFMEMALLKIIPWSMVEYEKIQYFDGDVMPTDNMDCFFHLPGNTFNTGLASPVNSGWFVASPNTKHFNDLKAHAVARLHRKWDEQIGWGKSIPSGVKFRGGSRPVLKYDFNGASLDQGLLFYYFVLNHGNVTLLDISHAKIYRPNFQSTEVSLDDLLRAHPVPCKGRRPIKSFAHFTGHNKPWLKKIDGSSDAAARIWAHRLDRLNLPLNSTNLQSAGLGSALGYFYPNKRRL